MVKVKPGADGAAVPMKLSLEGIFLSLLSPCLAWEGLSQELITPQAQIYGWKYVLVILIFFVALLLSFWHGEQRRRK